MFTRLPVLALLSGAALAQGQAPAPQQSAPAEMATLRIAADGEWVDSGIYFLPGDTFRVRSAEALLARVGDSGPAEAAGFDPVTEVTARGRLHLRTSDVPGIPSNNQKSVAATILYAQRPVMLIDFRTGSVDAARQWLAQYGFSPSEAPVASDAPVGIVVDQKPGARVDLHRVTEVILLVSTGPTRALVEVPDVVDRSRADAEAILRKSDLRPAFGESERSTLAADHVTRTAPVSGTPVERGSRVEYWLSVGPEPVVSPSPQRPSLPPVVDGATTRAERLIIALVAFLGVAGLTATVIQQRKQRRLRITKELTSIEAAMDDVESPPTPDGLSLDGPPIHFTVAVERGEAVFEGAIPVLQREVRHE